LRHLQAQVDLADPKHQVSDSPLHT
jgi:hypothetical protein